MYDLTLRLTGMNNPLVSQIYELRKDNYKDIRHLHTENAMTKRLATINQLISKIPPSQRVPANLKYKKLRIESRMILWKRVVYTTKDPCMTFTRFQMQLTDKHSYDGPESIQVKEAHKREQIVPLLNLELIKKSDDELRQIIADIQ